MVALPVSPQLHWVQQMMIANMLGLTKLGHTNLYQSENNLINKCILKLDDFKGDIRYL